MTDTPKKIVVNCATGGITEVPLTAAEIAERDQQAAAWAEEQANREAEAAAKAEAKAAAEAKLAALGLSAEEIAAISN
jgi:hypothetical protein